MKFFLAFVAIVAVVSAKHVDQSVAEFEAIVAAINNPSTDPATAALLEQQLHDTIASILTPSPIAVGPAIIDSVFEPIAVGPALVDVFQPISVGPAIVDFPIPDGGAVTVVEPSPVAVAPVVTEEASSASSASSPLVQIILNINSQSDATPVAIDASPVIASPVVAAPAVPVSPVQVVDFTPEVVTVVDVAAPSPVAVVEAAPTPVQVVDFVPETVAVASPIISAPAVSLPDTLN